MWLCGAQALRASKLGGTRPCAGAGAGAGMGGVVAGTSQQQAADNRAAHDAADAEETQGGSGSQQVGPPAH